MNYRPVSLVEHLQEAHRRNDKLELAQRLFEAGFPNTAQTYAFRELAHGSPENKLRAASLVAKIGIQNHDDILAPTVLEKFAAEVIHQLPPTLRGWSYYRLLNIQNRAAQSLQKLPESSASDPYYGHARFIQAFPSIRKASRSRTKIPEEALEHLKAAQIWFSRHPKHAREAKIAQLAIGRYYYTIGQYPESISAYQKVLDTPGLRDRAHLEIFWPLFMHGMYSQAQKHLHELSSRKQLESHPGRYIQQAVLEYQRCRYRSAQEILEQLLSIDPSQLSSIYPSKRLKLYESRTAKIIAERKRLERSLTAAPSLRSKLHAELKNVQSQHTTITGKLRKGIQDRNLVYRRDSLFQAKQLRFHALIAQSVSPPELPECKTQPSGSPAVYREKLQQAIAQHDQLRALNPKSVLAPKRLFHAATLRLELARIHPQQTERRALAAESVELLKHLIQEHPSYARLSEVKAELQQLLIYLNAGQVL